MTTGEWHIARVIEAQIVHGEQGSKNSFRYYVTYLDMNRRLDRWVSESEIKQDSTKILDELKSLEKAANIKKTNEEANLFENDEHLGMDKKMMQDHEEATKIKTINQIELGGNILETWYFSPFPREFHRETLYVCDFCLNFFIEKE